MERIYPTGLTDEQWQEIAPFVPLANPRGRPRRVDMRVVVNGTYLCFYVFRTGCPWRMRPTIIHRWSPGRGE